MRLVTVEGKNGLQGGVLCASGSVVSLERWGHTSVHDLIASGPGAWQTVSREVADCTSDWLAPISMSSPIVMTPRNLFCVGVNYASHYDEGERNDIKIPEYPVIFTKPWTTLIGPFDDLLIDPVATQKVDWEAELAVIIGVGGRNISDEDAMSHVFGYSLANDVSARDLQHANGRFSQWHVGKSVDGFCPFGPSVLTVTEVPDLAAVHIELSVNGVRKQEFSPKDMVHSIPRLIAYLSRSMALLPGDVLLTGTAAGVGHWQDPPQYLLDGDVIEIKSEVLGTLRNRVVEIRR